MSETIQTCREVPVTDSVDVLVVGAGIAGSVAAVAAAREGARTLVVDRFGYPGGNLGPGMICGAPDMEPPPAFADGLPGVPGEFVGRCEAHTHAPLLRHYFRDSQVMVYVWLRMFEAAGVQTLFNVWASEPIMDGRRVAGLVVEAKDGPRAIRARVVIDATGDADVAARAGAPTDEGRALFNPGAYFAMANVDVRRYLREAADAPQDPADAAWMERVAPELSERFRFLMPLAGYYRAAWEAGEYRFVREVPGLGQIFCDHGIFRGVVGVQYRKDPLRLGKYGLVGAMVGFRGPDAGPTSGSADVMTTLETAARTFIFETAQFLVRRVPGFEKAYLHMVSPYYNCRGGRSFIPEYRFTDADLAEGRRHDDVVFLGQSHRIDPAGGEVRYGQTFDWPYRQLLPREVEGLLGAGRASIVPPPHGLRSRWKMLMTGQAAGVAAALSARQGVVPRALDVTGLQSVLHHTYGVPLAVDADRLAQLGLKGV